MKLYFGFGANRDLAMIRAITGSGAIGISAHLEGFQLCTQTLQHIPKKVREILRIKWQDYFSSYGMVQKPHSKVIGKVWLVTDAQRQAIRRWEFVGEWSENIFVNVKVKLFGRSFYLPEESEHFSNQTVKLIDSQDYATFLVPKEKILRIAREVRQS